MRSLCWVSLYTWRSKSREGPSYINLRWFHVVLFIDHLYPFSTHVVRPSDVHTLGNSLCCHHSEDLVTRRYPCPFSERGIGSWTKKCFPTVASTLQSRMCSGLYVVLASESRSQMRLFRWTILVNPCVSTALIRVRSLVSSFGDSFMTFRVECRLRHWIQVQMWWKK